MAEALKDRIHPGGVDHVAQRWSAAWAPFDATRFRQRAKRGLTGQELLDRARHIAAALDEVLPADDMALEIFAMRWAPS